MRWIAKLWRIIDKVAPSVRDDDDFALLARSEYFDCNWYLSTYQDVHRAALNPIRHYLNWGAVEGRNPSKIFDTKWYQAHNPDVAASGLNPLVHYLRLGASNGKHPSPFVTERELAPSVRNDDHLDLLARSQYFDCNWYLSTYHDVDKAALNPIRHYLNSGAAEGRNPSKIFDTKWYQSHNPDAAASGLNPLVHYLSVGASKGKYPSPFAVLKTKVEASSAETENLLSVFSGPQKPLPGVANAHNWFENRQSWAEYFMSQGVSALRKSDLVTALDCLKCAAQVCPESRDPWVLYSHVFRLHNSEALHLFESNVRDAELLVTHICCERLIDAGRLSMQSFYDSSGRVDNIIVIGGGNERSFKFDPSTRILSVPSGDSYENLPMKVSRLYLFLGFSWASHPVLKVDDDIHCRDISKLHDDLNNVILSSDYGGRVISLPSPFHDTHHWHLGKCNDPAINNRPDGFFTWVPFADGPCYWLSPSSVNLLAKAALIHERYLEFERGIEDRAVGNILSYYGVRPVHAILTSAKMAADALDDHLGYHLQTSYPRGETSSGFS